MKAGTIFFNGADLALYGAPRFTLKRTPETAGGARATHRRVEISVTVELSAEMPATVWARAERLAALLAATAEGVLEIHSENGAVMSWLAVPGECSLPEAIARRSGRMDMSFTAREAMTAAEGSGLTIDPLDGSDIISIARVTDWSENIKISRPDSRSGVRSEVGSTLGFTARTAYADPLLPLAARAEFLLAEAERLKAIGSKEGRVVFAGFDRTVQFESISPKPSPGWEWLDLEAQARYVTLPGDTEAEVEFKTDSNEDPATGEKRITVSGKIEAPEKTTAYAKADAILAAWRTAGRRVIKIQKTDDWLDGEDAETPEWIGLSFSYEFSEGTDQTRYTLKIDTHEGADGARTTYSGTAYAATLEILLATIATAAEGKHPVETRSDLSVEYATDDEGTLKLLQGTFSHEYATPATSIRGTVTRANSNGQFQDWQATLSGSISAPSYVIARAVARKFIPAGVILRTDEETEEKAFVSTYTAGVADTATEQMVTLAFSYAWATAHTNTAIQYEETTSPDYSKMVEEITVSGTCQAVDKATALAAVSTLLTGMGLSNPTRGSLGHAYERQTIGVTTLNNWLNFKFSYSFEGAITGSVGHDIIEANFALQRIGMVDHEPMTEIPMGMPVKQIPFGHNIGRLVASGTVKARVWATAKAWGQGKRSQAETAGIYSGAADPPDERKSETYLPFNGTTVAVYEFSFQYGFRYHNGLTGLM